MPLISIPTSFNIDVEFEIPGFGRRLLAFCIDIAVQICYFIVVSKILSEVKGQFNTWEEDSAFNSWALGLISLVPIFLYHLVLEVTTNGQSLGKKLTHIRVVNINGGKASFSQFVIRWLMRVSDMWMLIILFMLFFVIAGVRDYETIMIVLFGMGFLITDVIMVVASKKSQRIGDILANTILIKTATNESLDNTVFREVEDTYVPMFPQVMRISDKDLNVIKSILDNCRKSGVYAPARSASDKIKGFLKVESNLEPEDFLDRLLKDYNYLSAR